MRKNKKRKKRLRAVLILLIILFGYLDGRPEMYVDIAMSYALIGFVGSVIIAKYLGGKDV